MRRPLTLLIFPILFAVAATAPLAAPKATTSKGTDSKKPVQAAKPSLKSPASPAKQTVCTITVNSPDEKEVFRRHLPESKFNFVELVERGRSDWLASSCKAATACDVLVVSGHFDGDNEFFSDQVESHELLAVSELERASCSRSCPSMFSQLKEVYLFGCNTLNHKPQSSVSADTVRDYVRDGRTAGDAERRMQTLNVSHGQSSYDRMRLLFRGVPAIYGFASTAPLGPTAAATLSKYFQGGGRSLVGTGRIDPNLLRAFSVYSMASARGITSNDPNIQDRRDMCQFADDRLPISAKLDFVHDVMQRPGDDTERYLDRIQRLAGSLDEPTRRQLPVARALADIASDRPTRERFLADARDADEPPTRVRMVNLAHDLGWLTDDQREHELALMLGELMERKTVGVQEIDLACRLNQNQELEGAFPRHVKPGSTADDVPHAAVRACLGSAEGRAITLDGLASAKETDVQAAQAYLRRRPITSNTELRRVATRIADMPQGNPQVRALDVLGRHYVSDASVLQTLTSLYQSTPSVDVQNAVAGVFLRADRKSIDRTDLLRVLKEYRKPAKSGKQAVDALMTLLEAA
ncbi:MAG TPA: hypothetical protein VFL64_03475 [Rhizobacter sp.]|nr:hypothetical protein [Rhizobacter sp.]